MDDVRAYGFIQRGKDGIQRFFSRAHARSLYQFTEVLPYFIRLHGTLAVMAELLDSAFCDRHACSISKYSGLHNAVGVRYTIRKPYESFLEFFHAAAAVSAQRIHDTRFYGFYVTCSGTRP